VVEVTFQCRDGSQGLLEHIGLAVGMHKWDTTSTLYGYRAQVENLGLLVAPEWLETEAPFPS